MFKKIIMKVGIIIMATTFIGLSACNNVNKDTSNQVETKLYEKYGEKFITDKIGNRLNTDSTTLYCHSVNKPDTIFSVKLFNKTKDISDLFVNRIQCVDIQDSLQNELGLFNIDACAFVLLDAQNSENETNTKISFNEFATKYNVTELFIRVAFDSSTISNETSGENIIYAFKKLQAKYEGKKLIITCFVIDAEKFSDCKKNIIKEAELSNAWFNNYSSKISNFSITFENNICSLNSNDIYEKLVGGE